MPNAVKFPAWFTALTALFFISNLFVFGGTALFNPELAFPNSGDGAVFPIQFFAIRHIAFAFPLAYGLIRRDVKVLTVMYTIFLIMSGLDILYLGLFDYSIPILGSIPFFADLSTFSNVLVGIFGLFTPVAIGLWYLTTQAK